MNIPFKILFKYPCRGRREMFMESLNSIYDNLADKNNFHVRLTLDEDDAELNNQEIKNLPEKYSNLSIAWGLSDSKIHAINRDIPDYDFDIIICWSNDMFATMFGFDDIIRQFTNFAFADMDGLIHFPEPDTKDVLNVLYIATRKYYDRFGYIYHPSYLSLWCDNESLIVAKMLGRYKYTGINGLYLHKNPAYTQYQVKRDELFDRQQGHWEIDEENFHSRRKMNFGLKEDEIVDKVILRQQFPFT